MQRTLFVPFDSTPSQRIGLSLGSVDLGQALAAVARDAWTEIVARAALVIQIEAAGPVVADERRLLHLLALLVRHVLEGIPPGDPASHGLRLLARSFGAGEVRVEIRHLPRLAPVATHRSFPPADPQLASWNHIAAAFGAQVSAEGSSLPASVVCIDLKLVV